MDCKEIQGLTVSWRAESASIKGALSGILVVAARGNAEAVAALRCLIASSCSFEREY